MIHVGYLNTIKKNVADSRTQSVAVPVFVVRVDQGWTVMCELDRPKPFEPVKDVHTAVKIAKTWIANARGTGLKKPKVITEIPEW